MIVAWLAVAWAGETVLVAPGSDWRFLDDGIGPTADWIDPTFDDSGWAIGPAPLGYGMFDIVTTVDAGPDPADVHPVTWLRHTFTVADASAFDALALHLRRDDGALVFLNGVELVRDNLPADPIDAETLAVDAITGAAESAFVPLALPPHLLADGDNVLAVQLHQSDPGSDDVVLDLSLSGWDGPTAVTRGPYLQQGTDHSMVVRWRTDGPSASRVWTGDTPGALTDTTDDGWLVFDHAVRVDDLAPDTEVAYAVGTPEGLVLAGDDADHVFRTAPVPGARRPLRIWVLGDSGTANADADAVRDAYLATTASPLDTDLWLMLGDNAYNSGTDAEYQAAVFDTYPTVLRQVPLWSTLGNHDGYTAFSSTQTGPYFDLFTFPTLGQAGGVPSGTEAWYSFDYANVHVVVLDSYHSSRLPGSPMLLWLEDDLAATTADWTLAIWHHPPYSRGSHDSDRETGLVEMRENVLPILEDHGVDLVMSGHSHSYERSLLLDGHYGTSDTFDPAVHLQQDHDGDPTSDGPYTKPLAGPAPHHGAVYVVAGSSGKVSPGTLDHPVMQVSLAELGSLVLDIDGDQLEGFFLDDLGMERDRFAIHKATTTILDMDAGDRLVAVGETLDLHGYALQPDGTEPPVYRWDFGDGTPEATGADVSHAWTAEGAYAVTLTVTDDIGEQATDSLVVYVDDGPPTIDDVRWTGPSFEGQLTPLSATASDPNDDPLSYAWNLPSGAVLFGASVEATFEDDGVKTVVLEVTDDALRTTSTALDVWVQNLPPALDAVSWVDAVEGSEATGVATVSDPGTDLVDVYWDFGDGTTESGTLALHTFPDSGTWPITLTLSDEDGGETVAPVDVVVANADPVVDGITLDGTLDEGAPITLSAVGSDPGASDVLSWSWDFGDGSPIVAGPVVVHAFPDDGPWTVTATADDGEGGVGSLPLELALRNVPPMLTTVPGDLEARVGQPWRYEAAALDVSGDPPAWTLDGPPTASVGADGVVTWTPGSHDADTVVWFSLSVDDGDGGGASQAWPLLVLPRAAGSSEPDEPLVVRDPGGAGCSCHTGGVPLGTALVPWLALWLQRRRQTLWNG